MVFCLLGVSAICNKDDLFRKHNGPGVIAGKAGYIGDVGRFCYDKTIGIAFSEGFTHDIEAGFQYFFSHISELINIIGRKNKVFFASAGLAVSDLSYIFWLEGMSGWGKAG